jgi:dienelactone hydrolase
MRRMRKLIVLLFAALPLFAQLERVAVLAPSGEADVRKDIAYSGELKLDLYRPRGAANALPVVVFLNGVGRPDLKEWGQYTSWPRLVASRGLAAVTHQTSGNDLAPQIDALFAYLRANAAELKIDPKRSAIWACSANARIGTAYLANHDELRAAVFYYGAMDHAPKNFQTPVLVARAGRDAVAINQSIERWVAAAVEIDAPVTYVSYPEGRHGFDVEQDSVESKRIIDQTLGFLQHHLTTEATPRKPEPMRLTDVQRLLGEGKAIAALQELHKTHPDAYVLEERTLNTLGYIEMHERRIANAVAILELVTKLYPQSANAHDSLGDAYEAAGRTADAIASSERALQLLPNAAESQRQGIRASAEGKLQRLKSKP